MTMLEVAKRFLGLHEVYGNKDNAFVVWALSLCGLDAHDETPWCSAFCNAMAFICGVERSRSAAARSWLAIGRPIDIKDAIPGNDVVIFQRGEGPQPGPDVLNAPGHVALFAGIRDGRVVALGGNQGDQVSITTYPVERVLGVRRMGTA